LQVAQVLARLTNLQQLRLQINRHPSEYDRSDRLYGGQQLRTLDRILHSLEALTRLQQLSIPQELETTWGLRYLPSSLTTLEVGLPCKPMRIPHAQQQLRQQLALKLGRLQQLEQLTILDLPRFSSSGRKKKYAHKRVMLWREDELPAILNWFKVSYGGDVAAILALRNLAELVITDCNMPASDLSQLTELPSLRAVALTHSTLAASAAAAPAWQQLAPLLQELRIEGSSNHDCQVSGVTHEQQQGQVREGLRGLGAAAASALQLSQLQLVGVLESEEELRSLVQADHMPGLKEVCLVQCSTAS
jgi:hypothetical protein